MFGNHPLPNITLSFLCFLPPPTHILLLLSPLPLTNAHMGQARACSSLQVASTPHHHAPSMPRPCICHIHFPAPPLIEGCGQTDSDNRPCPMPCHPTKPVTTVDDSKWLLLPWMTPKLPHHCYQWPWTTCHHLQQAPTATSLASMTPPHYHDCPSPLQGMWALKSTSREQGGARRWSKGGEKWGRRESGRHSCQLFQAWLSPGWRGFYSNGDMWIPHAAPLSFHFEWGSDIHAAPISFHFK